MYEIEITSPATTFINDENYLTEYWLSSYIEFENYSLNYQNREINISCDFSDIIASIKRTGYFNGGKIKVDLLYKFDTSMKHKKNFEDFVLLTFSDVLFLCFNLSFPGCMGIKRIKLNENFVDDIDKSGILFESIWGLSKKLGNWPIIQEIPLKDVIFWFNLLKIDFITIAENNIQRTLFSILYFSHDSYAGFNPSIIVWISQALESFYSIGKNDAILSSLKRRIFLHLGMPVQFKKIGGLINNFYDYRSKFVHGDMKILRQGSDKFWMSDVFDEYFLSLIQSADFGTLIVTCSIQKLIIDRKKEVSFSENIKYI